MAKKLTSPSTKKLKKTVSSYQGTARLFFQDSKVLSTSGVPRETTDPETTLILSLDGNTSWISTNVDSQIVLAQGLYILTIETSLTDPQAAVKEVRTVIQSVFGDVPFNLQCFYPCTANVTNAAIATNTALLVVTSTTATVEFVQKTAASTVTSPQAVVYVAKIG